MDGWTDECEVCGQIEKKMKKTRMKISIMEVKNAQQKQQCDFLIGLHFFLAFAQNTKMGRLLPQQPGAYLSS